MIILTDCSNIFCWLKRPFPPSVTTEGNNAPAPLDTQAPLGTRGDPFANNVS